MKKLLSILVLLITLNTFGQKPKVDAIRFEPKTQTEINALNLTSTDNWFVFNETTNKYQFYNGTSWENVDTNLTDTDILNFGYAKQIWVQNQGYLKGLNLANQNITMWDGTKLVDSPLSITTSGSGQKITKINTGYLNLYWDSSNSTQGDPGLFLYKDLTWIGGLMYDNESPENNISIWHNDSGNITFGSNLITDALIVHTDTIVGGATLKGKFKATSYEGNGSNLTNLNATNIETGTLDDARLSGNVARLNGSNNQNFGTGDATFGGNVTAPNLNLTNLQYNNTSISALVQAEVLGSEKITNGNFKGSSNWVLGTGWSILNGKAIQDGTGDSNVSSWLRYDLSQSVFTSGLKHIITFEVYEITGNISVNNANASLYIVTSAGIHEFEYTPVTDRKLNFDVSYGGTASLSKVSIREVISSRDKIQKRVLGSNAFSNVEDFYPAMLFANTDRLTKTTATGIVQTGITVDASDNVSGIGTLSAGAGTFGGDLTAPFFIGNGLNLTNLNATNITTGTLDDARLNTNILRTTNFGKTQIDALGLDYNSLSNRPQILSIIPIQGNIKQVTDLVQFTGDEISFSGDNVRVYKDLEVQQDLEVQRNASFKGLVNFEDETTVNGSEVYTSDNFGKTEIEALGVNYETLTNKPLPSNISVKTTETALTYTITNTDLGKVLPFNNNGDVVVTLNTNSLATIGDLTYIDYNGTGTLSINAGTGVVINVKEGLVAGTVSQFSRINIQKVTSSNYKVWGDINESW